MKTRVVLRIGSLAWGNVFQIGHRKLGVDFIEPDVSKAYGKLDVVAQLLLGHQEWYD